MAYPTKKPEIVIEDMHDYMYDLFDGNPSAQARIPSNTLMELARKLHCENATDLEFAQYMYYCVKYNLDPLLGYVECIKYNKNSDKPAQIFVGKRGMMTIAARNPNFVAATTDIHYKNPNVVVAIDTPAEHGQPVTCSKIDLGTDRKPEMYASCVVYRKDRDVPTYVEIKTKEYNTGNSTWGSKAETMSRKVALTQALEMAFPEDYANGFMPEEFGMTSDVMRKSPKFITKAVESTYAGLPAIALPNGVRKPAMMSSDDIEADMMAGTHDSVDDDVPVRKPDNVVVESADDLDEDSTGYETEESDMTNNNVVDDDDGEQTPFVSEPETSGADIIDKIAKQNVVPNVAKTTPPATETVEDDEFSLF